LIRFSSIPHKEQYQVAQKTFADPEGGLHPGYSKGAS